MFFVKENGTIVVFDKNKIKKAIVSAMKDGGIYLPDIARLISIDTEKYFLKEKSYGTRSHDYFGLNPL